MKTCSDCHEMKPFEDFEHKKRSKDGRNGKCRKCLRAYHAKYRATNPDVIQEVRSRYTSKHPDHLEKTNQRSRAWRELNPDRQRQAERNYRAANPDKRKETCKAYRDANIESGRSYRRLYYEKNKPRVFERAAERRFTKRQATPVWADRGKMRAFYELVPLLNEETGVAYNVDHIVPLRSRIVCGLHCEANLRVIPKLANLTKGNRFWPDMP